MSDYSNFCGIDLAKKHFRLHAIGQNDNILLHKQPALNY